MLETAATGLRQFAQHATQEGLTVMGSDGRALPRLAREWFWEDDGRTLRLVLREGVTFHDGTPLTAAVVAAAVRTMISESGNLILYPSFADIAAVRPVGELELVFELSRPSALLPEALALPLGVGPENVGTGAFRIVDAAVGEITFERFEDYHLGQTEVERMAIRSFPTLRTAWASLLRGEVDMVTNIPPDAIEFVSSEDVQIVPYSRPFQFLVAFNSQKAPFTSPTVRRALNLAVEREALIERVLRTRGRASTGPIWPQHWAYDHSIPPYDFDPDQAESLLDASGLTPTTTEAGIRERFRFTCLIPENFALVERVALEVQKQLYNIGVNIQFEVVPIREFDARVREGRFDAMLIDVISAPGLSHSQLFWRSAESVQGLNVFGYENPEAERLFGVLEETINEAGVRSATSRLQRVLLEDPPALFLAWTEGARAVRREFHVVQEQGRDPLHTIWRWTLNRNRAAATAD